MKYRINNGVMNWRKGMVMLCMIGAIVAAASERKVGVLLVNHGSRSATWRQSLLALEDAVRPAILTNSAAKGIKTAFMEYTEPSIATRLKEFDREGFTDVVIVPIFLTVSPHTFDDIPTIIGTKTDPHSMEMLKIEKIERYTPRAKVVIAPNLDFTDALKRNVLRRARELSKSPADEGLVMIAYGDNSYEKEWIALLNSVGEHIRENAGISEFAHGWCGHIAHYDPKKTTDAIESVLQRKKTAVVIPVLVARDEMFQIKIIGDGIAKVTDHSSRVIYRPDSILPDPTIEKWVTDISEQLVTRIVTGQDVALGQRTQP